MSSSFPKQNEKTEISKECNYHGIVIPDWQDATIKYKQIALFIDTHRSPTSKQFRNEASRITRTSDIQRYDRSNLLGGFPLGGINWNLGKKVPERQYFMESVCMLDKAFSEREERE